MNATLQQRHIPRLYRSETTRKIGPDTTNIVANLPDTLLSAASNLATRLHLGIGAFCRCAILNFICAIEPALGRQLIDAQIRRCKNEEALVLATIRRTMTRELATIGCLIMSLVVWIQAIQGDDHEIRRTKSGARITRSVKVRGSRLELEVSGV